jgi:hypothetical protein
MKHTFSAFEWQNGLLYDYSNYQFPTKLHALVGSNIFLFEEGSSYFIFQYESFSFINGHFPLPKDYFAVTTAADRFIQGEKNTKTLIIERIGYEAMFNIGGPIEAQGRLKYIDGCTDSLLIPPVKFGDPCLNHLHFPTHIDQTMHTHPSIRVGLVVKGNGDCVTPFGNIPLFPGQIFIIHPETGQKSFGKDGELYLHGSHCFRTLEQTMDVIAYHPDSDFGPKDEEHPMINRTIVDGVSAKHIKEIQTA